MGADFGPQTTTAGVTTTATRTTRSRPTALLRKSKYFNYHHRHSNGPNRPESD